MSPNSSIAHNALLVVRYGEVALKGRNRQRFIDTLLRNIKRAIGRYGIDVSVTHKFGRIYVAWDGSQQENIQSAIAKTFGVVSLSPAQQVDNDIDIIKQTAAEALQLVRHQTEVSSFKVESRRSLKTFPLNSIELNQTVGGYVASQHRDVQVDVHNPQVTVFVEVRSEGTLIYSHVIPAQGGLPVGSSSKAMLLLSGGIDSPAAAWFAMKRGIALEAVHFHSPPFTSERSLQKVRDLSAVLAEYCHEIPLHVVHFTEIQRAIQQHVPDSYGITIMRRFMLRIAERLAEKRKAHALVTGESVGQVASQTLESMRAISEVTTLPILRPLVGFDKMDIIDYAKQIGTYDLSVLPYEDCCTLFVPDHPQTKPRLDQVRRVEEPLPVDELVNEAVERTEIEYIHAP